ncbi:hypothetical protein BD779DRAFT_1469145 [Infundibulicybe gibba]|nr:hypothetical protein BD779DRAFT_1469145 [Infundibulicybe gibba]
MRFATLFTATTLALGAAASPTPDTLTATVDLTSLFGIDLTSSNHYGAPNPPWVHGANPGWYYGNDPFKYPELPCLIGIICKILDLFPYALHCPKQPPPPPPNNPPPNNPPPPIDGYTPTFSNLTGAIQADGFLTFGLVDTVGDCMTMCDSVSGCTFINAYHDVNGKGGSTQLTCSLFNACHNATEADNRGGQSQPDGSIDFITDSDGFCKS